MSTPVLPEGVHAVKLLDDSPERFARFSDELGIGSFGLNQILLQPGNRNRIHRHKGQEEVYVVLAGVLTLAIEGEEHDFPAGQVVSVATHVRRQIGNRGPGILSLLAIGGLVNHQHSGRDGEPFDEWTETEPAASRQVPEDYPASELRS